MGRLVFRLLGKFDARCDASPLGGLDARKLQEFLCYLLLNREHPFAREALVELLSAGAGAEQSRKYFRQVLWQLQAALNAPLRPDEPRLLIIDPEWVYFNPEAALWLDVAEFEAAYALAMGRSGETLPKATATCLESAVDLYRGDLMEGCYQDWCLFERERLQNIYLAMLDKLMGYCAAHEQYEAGVLRGANILRQDRARERTHQRLMHLYYLAGDRTAALRQYDQCVAALREELGVKPSKRTMLLYEQIRADLLTPPTPPADHAGGPAPSPSPDPLTPGTMLGQIKQSHDTLFSLQLQIRQDLAALEQMLSRTTRPDAHLP